LKIFRKGTKVLFWALAFSLLIPFRADAALYSFFNITNNNAGDAAIGESQLSVGVEPSGGQVEFTFYNIGTEASSITDVYFDDNTSQLLSIASITGSAGVSFSEGASPGNLPGGSPIGFSADFSADSDPPAQPNGVNPGENLVLAFNLSGSSSYANVLSAMNSGDMLVGIHVQGFASDGSESFVTPIPPTVLLLGSSLIGLVGIRRKFIS
jgi:hypothetical protein